MASEMDYDATAAAALLQFVDALTRAKRDDLGPESTVENQRRSDGCEVAKASWADSRVRRRNWGNLLLLFGVALLITIAILFIQLVDLDTATKKVTAAAAAVGTIVEGAAVLFLVKRQQEAETEVRYWAKIVNERCEV